MLLSLKLSYEILFYKQNIQIIPRRFSDSEVKVRKLTRKNSDEDVVSIKKSSRYKFEQIRMITKIVFIFKAIQI
jgi:hypothetical protein